MQRVLSGSAKSAADQQRHRGRSSVKRLLSAARPPRVRHGSAAVPRGGPVADALRCASELQCGPAARIRGESQDTSAAGPPRILFASREFFGWIPIFGVSLITSQPVNLNLLGWFIFVSQPF
uniref:Uncharacterized protein n=1 Tax=Knipowitschia caucasica TaxID=637954 RepID=A0AAV2KLD1_KNICA